MSQPAKKSAPAKSAPAKKSAPVKSAAASPRKHPNGELDLGALAANATLAPELPRMSRESAPNPFADIVLRSFESKEAFSLPPVADADVASVRTMLRRAAMRHRLGISVRVTSDERGSVITFQTKTKTTRKS